MKIEIVISAINNTLLIVNLVESNSKKDNLLSGIRMVLAYGGKAEEVLEFVEQMPPIIMEIKNIKKVTLRNTKEISLLIQEIYIFDEFKITEEYGLVIVEIIGEITRELYFRKDNDMYRLEKARVR